MSKKLPKTRHMMYEQQVKHSSFADLSELVNAIETKLAPKKYAVILHDEDIDGDRLVEPHYHAMMSFENPRTISGVSKELGDKPQQFTAWRGNANNGYAYLVHATKEALHKHQYNADHVVANFDYPATLKKIRASVEKANQTENIKYLLDCLYTGVLTKEEVESRLTGSQYGRYKRQIEDVFSKYLQNRAKEWRKEMQEQNKSVSVIWISGKAGVGKTSLARHYAEKKDDDYYITGSSRDLFQGYTGQHTLILDEFRPNAIPYQDLLRILDPFGEQAMLPSRYQDKALACDLIIITSPFDPLEFYNESFNVLQLPAFRRNNMTDSFEQLLRRITLMIDMNEYYITGLEFDSKTYTFAPIPNTTTPNTYFRKGQSNKTVNIQDLFKDICS